MTDAGLVIAAVDGGIALTVEQADALRSAGHLEPTGGQLAVELLMPGQREIPRTDLTRVQVTRFLIECVDLSVCDFCGRRGVAWEFPAEDFDKTSGLDRSIGAWRACDECGRLIRDGRRGGLARVAARRYRRPVRELRMLHDEFWTHRCGPGERI